MTLETIFYTQVGSVIAFVVAVFGLYRLLVQQKDGTIELLKERVAYLDEKVKDYEKQTPDVLLESVAKRFEIAKHEIARLKAEGEEYKGQLTENEELLLCYKFKLDKVVVLMADTDVVCPYCKGPLVDRNHYTIYFGDQEADVQRIEYECGYVRDEGDLERCRPCKITGNGV